MIFKVAIGLVIVIQLLFCPIPHGVDNSSVRRLPLITLGIIAISVLVFLFMLPTMREKRETVTLASEIEKLVKQNPGLLLNKEARQKLTDAHMAPEYFGGYDEALSNARSNNISNARLAELLAELDGKLTAFKKATETDIYFTYGFAPNGQWKAHQLLTHLFLWSNWLVLGGGMVGFFAFGYSLEDIWGRVVFLGFFLLAGMVACIPNMIFSGGSPLIGTLGATSAAVGAFMVRLPKARMRVFWIILSRAIVWVLRPHFRLGRRPWGVVYVPAYFFAPYYIGVLVVLHSTDSLMVHFDSKAPLTGFAFGILFALALKVSKIEERYLAPRVEQKSSFGGSWAVTDSFALIDQGKVETAEQKLLAHLNGSPQDTKALMALGQLYQKMEKYEQMNATYARLIRQYLSQGDKEGALYAYDGLLSGLPDETVPLKLIIRDWMVICEYLRERGMPKEAAVEYERLMKTCADDPLLVRACVQGGEAALLGRDPERGLRLFEQAKSLNPPLAYQDRITRGLDCCRGKTKSIQDFEPKR